MLCKPQDDAGSWIGLVPYRFGSRAQLILPVIVTKGRRNVSIYILFRGKNVGLTGHVYIPDTRPNNSESFFKEHSLSIIPTFHRYQTQEITQTSHKMVSNASLKTKPLAQYSQQPS